MLVIDGSKKEMGMRGSLLVGEDLIMTQLSLLGFQTARDPNKNKAKERRR